MEKIFIALQAYNLKETAPVVLIRESSDNIVYSIGEKDKKILRISKRLPIEDIAFEYEAIEYLRKGGVRVPGFVLTKENNFYVLIDGAVAVLFEFFEGHHIEIDKDHLPTEKQAFNAGSALGIMSNGAVGFKSSRPRERTIYSELERVLSLADIFERQFEGGKEFVAQVKEAIAFGKSQNEMCGFIHNDYRSGNVFFNNNDEVEGIIDFDWSCIGPIIKDLALAVVEWSFPDGATEANFTIFDAFLDGYNSTARIPRARNARFTEWIKFATLSDAATYFCDIATDPKSAKRVIRSFMYRKYIFFSNNK